MERRLIKTLFGAVIVLAAVCLAGVSVALAVQVHLPGKNIPQFVDPLPLLTVQGGPMQTIVTKGAIPGFTNLSSVELHMFEFQAEVLPTGTFAPGVKPTTTVWGYINGSSPPAGPVGTYIGPVFVTGRNNPTTVKFVNDLGNTGNSQLLFWKASVDQTLHWADPLNGQANDCAMANDAPAVGDCTTNYMGPIPAVPHLHGGEIPPVLDGGPNAWFLSEAPFASYSSATMHGNGYYSRDGNTDGNYCIYRYPNEQEAAPIWFHDHLLGGTRLNVYAGLAGAYIIEDPANAPPDDLDDPTKIIPLVVQDRMFDTNGELFFPNAGINPEHPFWIPEFEGDTIAVNGKVWPHLTVETGKRYRFLFINGSNARSYEMFLVNPVTKAMGPAMWQIETDGGYLDNPVPIDPNAPAGQLQKLVIMPGERAGVTIDFTGIPAGTNLILRNTARHPYPKGVPPDGTTLGRIIQFQVVADGGAPGTPSISYNPATTPDLRESNPIVRLPGTPGGPFINVSTVQVVRQLTLNEVMGAGGPLEVLVNNTKWSGKSSDMTTFPGGIRPDFEAVTIGGLTEYYSEVPDEGTTEIWEIVNLTADAHPIHTHLTQFQVLGRQNFNTNKYNKAYEGAFPGGVFIPAFGPPLNYNSGNPSALGGNPDITPFLQDGMRPPEANETGWKDTVRVLPGQVTRFVVRYSPLDTPTDASDLNYPFDPNAAGFGYVWHCHIVDHEDNEMMRPDKVEPMPGVTRTIELGTDY